MDENQFLSKEIYRSVYECGLEFIENSFESDLSITFIYMPFSGNLNDNEFLLNGFGLTYDPFREAKS